MKDQDETVAPKTLDAMSLDEIIAHRSALLTDYQNAKLAERYRALVTQVRDAATSGGYGDALPRAVAINYAKLLAYKDEYEVARLFTDGRFEKQLRDQFEGDFKFSFNLAPPMLARRRRRAGPAEEARLRRLDDAGVPDAGENAGPARHAARHFRPQRRPQARARPDRGLREGRRHRARPAVAGRRIDTAVEMLSLPDRIRGYGPVKEKAVQDAKARYAQLAADLVNPPPAPRQIAAE